MVDMADGSRHLVIDGSNIATEGRSLPSLAQLDEAVRELVKERPFETWTVVVDATFGHRIDASEKQTYEEALAANELVTPPAGTIGRGDKFLLEIANRSNATVFSNDSFQEFHGEYDWLFDDGRLIGGKPVPEVGWIFTERTPVRGPKSRMSTRGADRRGRLSAPGRSGGTRKVLSATGPLPVPTTPPPRPARREPVRASRVTVAPESALERVEVERETPTSRRRSSSSSSSSPADAVNEPLPFIQFIAEHGLGQQVQGEVLSFTSHGAFVQVGDVRCYLALKFMGDPAPRSARAVLDRGAITTFVVQAIDAPRRGIDLAMPGLEDLDEDRAPERLPTATDEITSEAPPRRSRARKRASTSGGGDETMMATPGSTPALTPSEADRPSRLRRARTVASASDPAPATVVSASEADGEGLDEENPLMTPARKRASRKRVAGTRSTASTEAVPALPTIATVPGEVARAEAGPGESSLAGALAGEGVLASDSSVDKTTDRRVAARPVVAKRTATKRLPTATPVDTESARTRSSIHGGPAEGVTVKKAVVKKAATKKAVAKKAVAKKAVAKKAVAKKAVAKKAVAERAPTEEVAGEDQAATETPAREVATKKGSIKKAPTKKKAVAKKAVANMAVAAKPAATKPAATKAPGTRAPAKRATTKRTLSPVSPATGATATATTTDTPLDTDRGPEEA